MFEKSLQKGKIWAAGTLLAVCMVFFTCAVDIYGGTVNDPDSETGEEGGGAIQSSNAYLKSLNVTPGTLSPEFSPEITSYTVNVEESVDKVSVTCSVEEAASKVIEASGFKGLKQGSNSAFLTVQAADGSKCTYNLTINRGAASGTDSALAHNGDVPEDDTTEPDGGTPADAGKPSGSAVTTSAGADIADGMDSGSQPAAQIDPDTNRIPIGGESIYSSFQIELTCPQELLPEGFVMESYDYKGITVESGYFAAGGIRLLYLTTGDGTSSDFRIYYEDTDTFMDLLQITGTDGRFIMPVRYEAQIKIPDNYTGTYLPWENKVVPAYIYTELTGKPVTGPGEEEKEDSEEESGEQEEPVKVEELDEEVEFYLLFAMNQEGKESFYLYDAVEGTYQRYVERDTSYELDQSYFKYKDIAHKRFAIMCVMACLLLIAGFCIINLVIKNRELKADLDGEDDEDEDDEEDERDDDEGIGFCRKRKDTEKKTAAFKDRLENMEKEPEKKERRAVSTEKKPKAAEERRIKEAALAEKAKDSAQPAQAGKAKEPAPALKKEKEDLPAKKKAVKADPVSKKEKETSKNTEIDASSLEAKIIEQLRLDDDVPQRPRENTADEPKERAKRPARKQSSFKMINLSREPESSALDDDFEFEFINLDDD